MKKLATVIRHSLETGQETEIYRKAAAPDIGGLTMSPDGTFLSFSTADEMAGKFVIRVMRTAGGRNSKEVWVMEHFLPVTKGVK